MRAACLIPGPPHYGRELFLAGLRAAGCQLVAAPAAAPTPADVLVIWNRRPHEEHLARRYEQVGATVIVVENGYLGADDKPPAWYAMARGHHLGVGTVPAGPARWPRLGVDLRPWRTDGEHILVLPQRSIGERGVAMPLGWTEDVVRRLKRATSRPIRVRAHPGKRPHQPMEPDLAGAWAVVTWGSGAALKAIVAGVPAFHELPGWIGAPAARQGIDDIERPFLGDRLPMLRRLAWAQWAAAEIQSGEPFAWLLRNSLSETLLKRAPIPA